MRFRLAVFIQCVSSTFLLGCGNGMIDLKAKVTLDGKPLDGAAVTLISSPGSGIRGASGMSDANGDVQFTTFQPGDGVLPGEYKVVVTKTPKSIEEEMASYDRNNPEDMERLAARERGGANAAFTASLLPRHYLSPDTTPLSCKVPSDEDVVEFALSSSKSN
ncbi:MAG: carboxypeptidase-like regulatory domain-containing protein [Pirellulales bacterium]